MGGGQHQEQTACCASLRPGWQRVWAQLTESDPHTMDGHTPWITNIEKASNTKDRNADSNGKRELGINRGRGGKLPEK